jgi:hypothetical protein
LIQDGCSTFPQTARNLFSSKLKRAVSVDFVSWEGLERFLPLKAQMVRCESLRRDECLATWQTEIHGGIAEWDIQSGEPSAELLPSGDPP